MTSPRRVPGLVRDIVYDMRDYANWKSLRDVLIVRALELGVPVERIAAEMQISPSVVRKVRKDTSSDR